MDRVENSMGDIASNIPIAVAVAMRAPDVESQWRPELTAPHFESQWRQEHMQQVAASTVEFDDERAGIGLGITLFILMSIRSRWQRPPKKMKTTGPGRYWVLHSSSSFLSALWHTSQQSLPHLPSSTSLLHLCLLYFPSSTHHQLHLSPSSFTYPQLHSSANVLCTFRLVFNCRNCDCIRFNMWMLPRRQLQVEAPRQEMGQSYTWHAASSAHFSHSWIVSYWIDS